jgi:hypothetical protein
MDAVDVLGEAEATALQIYRRAGLAPTDVLRPSLLATALLGRGRVRVEPIARLGAVVERRDGSLEIHVSDRVRPENVEWVVGHELAHIVRRTNHVSGSDEEHVCDCASACMLMPRRPFLAAIGRFGENYPALAEAFGTSPEAAAIRWGEVTGEGRVVVTPRRVYAAGEVQIGEEQARGIAARGAPGVVSIAIGRKRRVLRAG